VVGTVGRSVSSQRCVNYYAEKEPPDAKTDVSVLGVPGIVAWVTAGTACRGFNVMNNVLYIVSGSSLYSVDTTLMPVLLGSGIVGQSFVPMADNGIQVILMANGEAGFVYNSQTNVFVQITDPNFFPSNTVTFFDEYFLLVKNGTNEWFFSNILDGTTYNALDFESALRKTSGGAAMMTTNARHIAIAPTSASKFDDVAAPDVDGENRGAHVSKGTVEENDLGVLGGLKHGQNLVLDLG
jgi:hypothetical protein